jgi:hypothetical protein
MHTGTRVEVRETTLDGIKWYPAKIARWTRAMGSREYLPEGYEPVRYDSDGAVLMIHRSCFRIVT